MNIVLDHEWSIEDDGSGYTLNKWTGKTQMQRNGTETKSYDVQKYPCSLANAIAMYARFKVVGDHEKLTLADYVKEYTSVLKRVEKLLIEAGINK